MTAPSAASSLDTLRAEVRGPVLEPGDPGYAEEAAGFNVAHQPAAAVVVGATCTADVVAAVRYARAVGRRVAVQATGHGLVDELFGTVLVTTGRMDAVAVDPGRRRAVVGAGVRGRAVLDAAAPHGLTPLCGSSSDVGVVGFSTGGGIGPLSRRYGFGADHVRRATLVTADGAVHDLDETSTGSDADLYWAVRGGKGSVGVVTELELDLLPVAGFHGGAVMFDGADAAAVLHAWREWTPTLTEDTSTSVALLRLPPLPELPEPVRGRFVVAVRFTHLGAGGPEILAPMRAVATPLLDTVTDLPAAAVDAVHMDPTDPLPMWDRGTCLATLEAGTVDALLAHASEAVMMIELRLLGGALARTPEVPDAVSGREAAYSVFTVGILAGPDAERVPEASAAIIDALRPWESATGLVNFLGQASPERVGAVWPAADRARLVAIARAHDPERLFATNIVID